MTLDEIIELHEMKAKAATIYNENRNNVRISVSYTAEEHEQLVNILRDYKFLMKWKDDIVEDFCRYDANSLDELVRNVRRKTCRDFVREMQKTHASMNNIPKMEKENTYAIALMIAEKLQSQGNLQQENDEIGIEDYEQE